MKGLKTFEFLHQCIIYQTTGLWTTGRSFSQRWVFTTELHCDVRPSGTNYGQLPNNGLRTTSAHHCDDMPVSLNLLNYLSLTPFMSWSHLFRTRQHGKQTYDSYWPGTCATKLTFSSSKGKVKVSKIQETQEGPITRRILLVLPKNSTVVRVHVHQIHV